MRHHLEVILLTESPAIVPVSPDITGYEGGGALEVAERLFLPTQGFLKL